MFELFFINRFELILDEKKQMNNCQSLFSIPFVIIILPNEPLSLPSVLCYVDRFVA